MIQKNTKPGEYLEPDPHPTGVLPATTTSPALPNPALVLPLQGLSLDQVAERTAKGLVNTFKLQTSRTYTQILKDNIFTFLNFAPGVVGLVMVILGLYTDAIISVGVVFFNSAIGLFQEIRAKRKLDQIIVLSRPKARVVREGKEQDINPTQVVVGDILVVRPGDQFVVDGEIVSQDAIEADESLISGEADPQVKKTGEKVLSGSYCLSGIAFYEAQKVGAASFANTLTSKARAYRRILTPLQTQLNQVVRGLFLIAGYFGIMLLITTLVNHLTLKDTVQQAAVIVALVPNGLFMMVSLAYGLGAVRLARKGILVQQFNAIESLSNVDVLCLDKTGTLTTNRLHLETVYPVGLSETDLGQLLGDYASSTSGANKTIEAIAAHFGGQARPAKEEVVFSSERKWSALNFDLPQLSGIYVLGAPEILKSYTASPFSPELEDQIKKLSGSGLRLLLFAADPSGTALLPDKAGQPHLTAGLKVLGLIGLRDELRPGAGETLKAFSKVGITFKIISGDNPQTVAALAKQAGLGTAFKEVSGLDLKDLDERGWQQLAEENTIFGRIAPEQKEQLVAALRRNGHYVAMIGDGINDVLSLKKANLAIAMGSGSQATRGAADILLLEDSWTVLPEAFQEGQRIRNAMRDNLKLHLPRIIFSTLIILSLAVSSLGFPFLPRQSSIITFLTVGLPVVGITIWARPGHLAKGQGLIYSTLPFVIPAALTRFIVGLGTYVAFYLSTYQDLQRENPRLLEAELIRQSEVLARNGLITITILTGLLMLIFARPPVRWLAEGVEFEKSVDWRPVLLTCFTLLLYIGILLIPQTRELFDLTLLSPLNYLTILGLTLIWTVTLQLLWKTRLVERFLGVSWEI